MVGSTNTIALDRAEANGEDRVWYTAERQLAGRGRSGRIWVSEPGNLYASVVLRNPCGTARLAELAFVAAIAARDAIGTEARIKWPNDILLNGAKVAGLLLEARSLGSETAVVCGFGVNCRHAPEAVHYPTAVLDRDRFEVFGRLTEAFASAVADWQDSGFASVRQRWLRAAQGLGESIVVRQSGMPDRHGTFEALSEDGCLALRRNDGAVERISAGDIFFATR